MDIAALFDLVKPIVDYGFMTVFAAAMLTLLVRVGWIYFSEKYLKKYVSSDFSKHSIFRNLTALQQVKIPAIKLSERVRTIIVQDMLKIIIESFTISLKSFIEKNGDKKGLKFENNDAFYDAVYASVLEAHSLYEDKWKDVGIPEICIDKFKEWHNQKNDLLYAEIKSISTSSFHQSYNDKFNSMLEMINLNISMSIIDVEYTLKSLNGDLTGQLYKGLEIGELDYEDEESNRYIVKKNPSWREISKTPRPGMIRIDVDPKKPQK
jgi:hypothetical protein